MSALEPEIHSVTDTTRQIKNLVEGNFPYTWVIGEISNCTIAGSGHVYLTLKDDAAQLRAVIWKRTASRLKFQIEDGMEVVAAGPIEVYQARGTYQLNIEQLLPQGVGALELAFRQMQEKLAAEGLFDAEYKRPIPQFPRKIALVTSPTSAAVRDMLQVITRRWNAVDLVIVPVAVQGEGAAEQIAAGIKVAERLPQVDTIITGRGGGSLEDLWAFNEEVVARAIFECQIPIISAVGHEIDISIADLVADRRALTPSEAAELAVPLQSDISATLTHWKNQLVTNLKQRARQVRFQLDALADRPALTRPLDMIHHRATQLDELDRRLKRSTQELISRFQSQTTQLSSALDALSPLKVLSRGYSISRVETGKESETTALIKSIEQIKPGDTLQTQVSDGTITSQVQAVAKEPQSETTN
ncbi:MAG: exodeoxyribonuclease VII large subunit [Planctomycetes bacterium]|nr:exodeoxyribonuclease VII large subunit [Planctomycetota bacterium]MCH9725883.1 exodeoxyribonuclease VII large subunit [Planctomycetota bacterium]MCH9777036.1 exodeoxyribonuclease VII large subunit [Planctomycetota bacterium]MCH9789665.1 exodeoxyribonuclease VII large subunit [Planctomycetota bacterium]MDF1742452.1 exodeoxyribonuclease VII large subunit [Gimesia sp.]